MYERKENILTDECDRPQNTKFRRVQAQVTSLQLQPESAFARQVPTATLLSFGKGWQDRHPLSYVFLGHLIAPFGVGLVFHDFGLSAVWKR